ncbi:Uu.00g111340.m01.CDS01 [Anthostomella pinea]|uniref:Uu.00g111340.m01.CDS01 n=1 Tax=Anthostomella pinea TaxID=933095 RepID=A0AAI8VFL3_9PEZI|nr:Uu.00g111340.m01.CDS01 [Anthostomella pinea]
MESQWRRSLRQHPDVGSLFGKEIASTDTLRMGIEDSAFVALDTELRRSLPSTIAIPLQVGVAYMPSLEYRNEPFHDSLQNFTQRQHILASATTVMNDMQRQPLRQTERRSMRFGHDLSTELGEFYSAKWSFLAQFPRLTRHFSAWLDVKRIIHDAIPQGKTAGLRGTLTILGYPRTDTNRHGQHNAGDDAVITLAALEAVLVPENQATLRFKQLCRQIILPQERLDLLKWPFAANIRTLDHAALPESLNSAVKLSERFFADYVQDV